MTPPMKPMPQSFSDKIKALQAAALAKEKALATTVVATPVVPAPGAVAVAPPVSEAPSTDRKLPEIQQEYTAVCAEVGHRIFLRSKIDTELQSLLSRCATLDVESRKAVAAAPPEADVSTPAASLAVANG